MSKHSFQNAVRVAVVFATLTGLGGGAAFAQRYEDRDGYRHDDSTFRVAHDSGFADGASVGREDSYHGKAFQPFPRGRYRDADRGYRHEYGDRYDYRRGYSDGYSDGYRRNYERSYRRY